MVKPCNQFYGKDGSRKKTIKTVKDWVNSCGSENGSNFCYVEGPAGIGKSRAIEEVLKPQKEDENAVVTIHNKTDLIAFLEDFAKDILNKGIDNKEKVDSKITFYQSLGALLEKNGDIIQVLNTFKNFLQGIKHAIKKKVYFPNDCDGHAFPAIEALIDQGGISILMECNYLGNSDIRKKLPKISEPEQRHEVPAFLEKTACEFICKRLCLDRATTDNPSKKKEITDEIIEIAGRKPYFLKTVCVQVYEKLDGKLDGPETSLKKHIDEDEIKPAIEDVLRYLKVRHKDKYEGLQKKLRKGEGLENGEGFEGWEKLRDLGIIIEVPKGLEVPSLFKKHIDNEIDQKIKELQSERKQLWDERLKIEKRQIDSFETSMPGEVENNRRWEEQKKMLNKEIARKDSELEKFGVKDHCSNTLLEPKKKAEDSGSFLSSTKESLEGKIKLILPIIPFFFRYELELSTKNIFWGLWEKMKKRVSD